MTTSEVAEYLKKHPHVWEGIKPNQVNVNMVCGYCGRQVASTTGLNIHHPSNPGNFLLFLRLCPSCDCPNLIQPDEKSQFPVNPPGERLRYSPEEITRLYDEARACYGFGAYTATTFLCQKILSGLAVSLSDGSVELEQSFIYYLNWLEEHRYLHAGHKPWTEQIRSKGIEKSHEIRFAEEADARVLILLTEALLKFIYEVLGSLEAAAPIAAEARLEEAK